MNETTATAWPAPRVPPAPRTARALWDTGAGNGLTIRTSVRLLFVDVPEIPIGVDAVRCADERFARLARWIEQRPDVPVTRRFAEYLLPRIGTGRAATLQCEQGRAAAVFARDNAAVRLTRPEGTERDLFLRTAVTPFDHRGRLWALVAPYYSAEERRGMTRAQRATFNLDMVLAGWAVPLIVYPPLPAAPDLVLLREATVAARAAGRGIWADPETLLPHEYRAVERLSAITEAIVAGNRPPDPDTWQLHYCADMRTRVLHGPEDYLHIPPSDRLWLWPADIIEALGRLHLTFSDRILGTW
ncbi:nuclease [Rhodococcus ruber BKS 20-38]|uniref:Nuclease n=1 Tax=Rhodococcus ruber BKS 20-38 TaxID=1278076 RepID=M2XTA1_9NOCA|nr:hypothetical protein [Rhodococcus ruber]EME64196.1 nuclease [Rhodococcus ruber BKS 20-38]